MTLLPKLTCEMVARLQGWDGREYRWEFTGRKTSNYRQIGNAFPPPVARAIGDQIRRALDHQGEPRAWSSSLPPRMTRSTRSFAMTQASSPWTRSCAASPPPSTFPAFERHLAHLKRDFHIEVETRKSGDAYRLGAFKAFVGQDDHLRHEAFLQPDQDQLTLLASAVALHSQGPADLRAAAVFLGGSTPLTGFMAADPESARREQQSR